LYDYRGYGGEIQLILTIKPGCLIDGGNGIPLILAIAAGGAIDGGNGIPVSFVTRC
jgi:hypothetical protein